MKTRTLLLLAVACAFVILIAGSIKIFLIADEEPVEHLAVGQSGTVGDMRVEVLSARAVEGQLLVHVLIGGVVDDDGATTFEFRNGRGTFDPVPPLASETSPCAATTADDTECVVAFATTDVPGLVIYERTSQDKLRWEIVAP